MELRRSLGLDRAVETGTYRGNGAQRLANIFPKVVTIELSDELYERARTSLRDRPTIEVLHGDSRVLLPSLVEPEVATLFFLDGHWSGGSTAGQEFECPVLDELVALRGGNPNDCLFIDDARLFAAAPAPPHDPSHWPTLVEVFDAVHAVWPRHHLTLLADQVIAVPPDARPLVDGFGQELARTKEGWPRSIARLLMRLR
jgi:hypothetical protein